MNRKSNLLRNAWILGCGIALVSIWTAGEARAQPVQSGNGRYEASYDERNDQIVVSRITRLGHRRTEYTINGRLDEMYLSLDGAYLISCRPYLQSDYRPDEVVVRIFQTGTLRRSIGLNELPGNPRDLPSTVDASNNRQHRWGECLGFVSDDRQFQLTTVGGRLITVDLRSERMTLRHAGDGGSGPSADDRVLSTKPLIDCDEKRGNPFLAHIFCDNFDQYVPGWRQVRGKWEFETGADGDAVLYQRSDRSRENNALMYFDNQLFSDFDMHTYVKVEPNLPTLAIDEDEALIREVRWKAGAGLIFRFRDESNYYMFRLAGLHGAVLGKMVDGVWYDLANPRADDFLTQGRVLEPEQWLGLRVRVRDNNIQCWIGERTTEGDWSEDRWQAVINTHDSTFSTGRVGLVTFRIKAKFAYLAVFNL